MHIGSDDIATKERASQRCRRFVDQRGVNRAVQRANGVANCGMQFDCCVAGSSDKQLEFIEVVGGEVFLLRIAVHHSSAGCHIDGDVDEVLWSGNDGKREQC